ncbi:MAG TPA: RDD family protein [Acidimicrobiales bacterium]
MGGLPPPPGPADRPADAPFTPGAPPPPPPPGGWPAPPPAPPGGAPPGGPFGAPGGPSGPAAPYGGPGGFGGGRYAAAAGFGPRLGAYLIDAVVTGLFAVPAYIALLTGDTKIEPCSIDESGRIDPGGTIDNGLCEVPTGGTWALFGVLLAAGVVAAIVYFAKLEGGSGQTLGKRAVGIRVVDLRTGGPIGTGRAVGRYFARIPSGLVCGLGYLWMLWDPQRQTWHDKLANSQVVQG